MSAISVLRSALHALERVGVIRNAAGQRRSVLSPSQRELQRAMEEIRVENLRLRRVVECAERMRRPHAEPCMCFECENWMFLKGTIDGLHRADERQRA